MEKFHPAHELYSVRNHSIVVAADAKDPRAAAIMIRISDLVEATEKARVNDGQLLALENVPARWIGSGGGRSRASSAAAATSVTASICLSTSDLRRCALGGQAPLEGRPPNAFFRLNADQHQWTLQRVHGVHHNDVVASSPTNNKIGVVRRPKEPSTAVLVNPGARLMLRVRYIITATEYYREQTGPLLLCIWMSHPPAPPPRLQRLELNRVGEFVMELAPTVRTPVAASKALHTQVQLLMESEEDSLPGRVHGGSLMTQLRQPLFSTNASEPSAIDIIAQRGWLVINTPVPMATSETIEESACQFQMRLMITLEQADAAIHDPALISSHDILTEERRAALDREFGPVLGLDTRRKPVLPPPNEMSRQLALQLVGAEPEPYECSMTNALAIERLMQAWSSMRASLGVTPAALANLLSASPEPLDVDGAASYAAVEAFSDRDVKGYFVTTAIGGPVPFANAFWPALTASESINSVDWDAEERMMINLFRMALREQGISRPGMGAVWDADPGAGTERAIAREFKFFVDTVAAAEKNGSILDGKGPFVREDQLELLDALNDCATLIVRACEALADTFFYQADELWALTSKGRSPSDRKWKRTPDECFNRMFYLIRGSGDCEDETLVILMQLQRILLGNPNLHQKHGPPCTRRGSWKHEVLKAAQALLHHYVVCQAIGSVTSRAMDEAPAATTTTAPNSAAAGGAGAPTPTKEEREEAVLRDLLGTDGRVKLGTQQYADQTVGGHSFGVLVSAQRFVEWALRTESPTDERRSETAILLSSWLQHNAHPEWERMLPVLIAEGTAHTDPNQTPADRRYMSARYRRSFFPRMVLERRTYRESNQLLSELLQIRAVRSQHMQEKDKLAGDGALLVISQLRRLHRASELVDEPGLALGQPFYRCVVMLTTATMLATSMPLTTFMCMVVSPGNDDDPAAPSKRFMRGMPFRALLARTEEEEREDLEDWGGVAALQTTGTHTVEEIQYHESAAMHHPPYIFPVLGTESGAGGGEQRIHVLRQQWETVLRTFVEKSIYVPSKGALRPPKPSAAAAAAAAAVEKKTFGSADISANGEINYKEFAGPHGAILYTVSFLHGSFFDAQRDGMDDSAHGADGGDRSVKRRLFALELLTLQNLLMWVDARVDHIMDQMPGLPYGHSCVTFVLAFRPHPPPEEVVRKYFDERLAQLLHLPPPPRRTEQVAAPATTTATPSVVTTAASATATATTTTAAHAGKNASVEQKTVSSSVFSPLRWADELMRSANIESLASSAGPPPPRSAASSSSWPPSLSQGSLASLNH